MLDGLGTHVWKGESMKTRAVGSVIAASLVTIGLVSGWPPAHGEGVNVRPAPTALAVNGELPKLPPDVTDLKFHEFFTMPVGPRGLEPTEKLLSLNGQRVRVVGYMAQQEAPVAGLFHLTPLPVALGEEDESLADSLPPSTVFV